MSRLGQGYLKNRVLPPQTLSDGDVMTLLLSRANAINAGTNLK